MARNETSVTVRPVAGGVVIADASPLIALSLIERLDLLRALFGHVSVVSAVRDEVLDGHFAASELVLRAAFDAGWLKIVALNANPSIPQGRKRTTVAGTQAPVFPAELDDLDAGEAASLRYAASLAEPTLVLIDETAGRRVAAMMGIAVASTAAVLGMAKRRGLVNSAKAEFARLHAADFWISAPVIRTVLTSVGET